MGRMNYHWAMGAVIDHFLDSVSCSPALVVFQTDSGPTSRIANKALRGLAGEPVSCVVAGQKAVVD
ncbi:hypothetical protein [Streptomyces sp. TLI_55]|uniref:hypothetical protein n=1 Tax=Streptomyces sp. TLI_55 TaxID=1938861 RepID=UPI0026B9911B